MGEVYAKFALAGLLAIIVTVLVLTGHDGAQGTIAVTAALTLIIGILFRDATGQLRKVSDKEPPTGKPNE